MNMFITRSVWKFGLLCGLAGVAVASSLAAGWYAPLVSGSPAYGTALTRLSTVLWPSAHMVGGWVGPWDPLAYWLRVSTAVVTNGCIYAVVGGFGLFLVQRIRVR